MKRTNILLILGFISLCIGTSILLIRPYNILKNGYLSFILIALGTFLIIAEIITYNWYMYKE